MGDFLKCPRAYYLKNIYKDPKTGRKIGITSPALSLGSAVHEVVEGLANYPANERQNVPMLEQFEKVWLKFTGKRGGFTDKNDENEAKERGLIMIKRVKDNLAPLLLKTVKLKEGKNGMPPNYLLSEEENIILCGKIDWLQYSEKDNSVHVLDFKTGRNEEDSDSLQLPIYQLLLKNLQNRKVNGASYWYLDRDDAPKEVDLPDVEECFEKVFRVAKQVKDIRDLASVEGTSAFKCPRGERGCFACQSFEKIVRGKAEYVGPGDWQDLYFVN